MSTTHNEPWEIEISQTKKYTKRLNKLKIDFQIQIVKIKKITDWKQKLHNISLSLSSVISTAKVIKMPTTKKTTKSQRTTSGEFVWK